MNIVDKIDINRVRGISLVGEEEVCEWKGFAKELSDKFRMKD